MLTSAQSINQSTSVANTVLTDKETVMIKLLPFVTRQSIALMVVKG